MLEFIQILKQRYQAILPFLDPLDPTISEYNLRIEQLLLAEAFLRKGEMLEAKRKQPLHIAVIGPTQAGKSTLVNLLLDADLAGVSPLAGYTVHPQGFVNRLANDDWAAVQHYFGRFQQRAQDQLNASRYDCYSVNPQVVDSARLPDCVLWDTPDFDSIDAEDYQEGVIRTIALADMLVLVLSKEKYADQSVWDMLKKVAAFHQPLLICVNKLTEGSEQIITSSLQEKWQQCRDDSFPPVIPLFYDKQAGHPQLPADFDRTVSKINGQIKHNKHAQYRQQLVQQHWRNWLQPVVEELEAEAEWQQMIEAALEQAAQDYQRDYLNHPHHYQTFQDALVELLNLLELPGIAKVLGKTRRVMTWPVRKVFQLGKKYKSGDTQENVLLKQIGEHVLIQLADTVWEKSEQDSSGNDWWKDGRMVLRQLRQPLLEDYEQGVEAYHAEFRQDVEQTAHRLYYQLQEQPLILNTLRATRATTDATALALAINTGGIGLHDLVITPAMLSVTSLLAESAAGSYMKKLEAELKQHQLNTVKQLFAETLANGLNGMTGRMPHGRRFSITRQQLDEAEQALKEKRHGLRIL